MQRKGTFLTVKTVGRLQVCLVLQITGLVINPVSYILHLMHFSVEFKTCTMQPHYCIIILAAG